MRFPKVHLCDKASFADGKHFSSLDSRSDRMDWLFASFFTLQRGTGQWSGGPAAPRAKNFVWPLFQGGQNMSAGWVTIAIHRPETVATPQVEKEMNYSSGAERVRAPFAKIRIAWLGEMPPIFALQFWQSYYNGSLTVKVSSPLSHIFSKVFKGYSYNLSRLEVFIR